MVLTKTLKRFPMLSILSLRPKNWRQAKEKRDKNSKKKEYWYILPSLCLFSFPFYFPCFLIPLEAMGIAKTRESGALKDTQSPTYQWVFVKLSQ